MINTNDLFVVYKADGDIRLMGCTSSSEFIEVNTFEGDTTHWGDAVAIAAHGLSSYGEEIEFNIV